MKLLSDLKEVSGFRDLVFYLSWHALKQRYRRTVIGPFWATTNMAIFVLAFGVVGSNLWGRNIAEFLPYFCSGYLVWNFLSKNISDSGAVFTSQSQILTGVQIPLSVFVLASIGQNILLFAHHFLVFIVVAVYFRLDIGWEVFLVVPGLVFFAFVIFNFSLFWGMLCARYRDLTQLTSNILQILFFLTPIMWPKDQLEGDIGVWLVNMNPVYHLISIIREPMLGYVPSLTSYLVSGAIGLLCLGMSWIAMERFKHRLVFWL